MATTTRPFGFMAVKFQNFVRKVRSERSNDQNYKTRASTAGLFLLIHYSSKSTLGRGQSFRLADFENLMPTKKIQKSVIAKYKTRKNRDFSKVELRDQPGFVSQGTRVWLAC